MDKICPNLFGGWLALAFVSSLLRFGLVGATSFVLALIHYISVHAQASIVLRLTRLLSNGRQHEEL